MRTTNQLNQNEIAAYQAFCRTNRIALDGADGEKNGELFADYIGVRMDADFTQETLETAFEQLQGKLKLVSETYQRADELARNLSPDEQQIYRAWAARQKLLIGLDGSPEGVENVATLLGWFRGNAVTAHHLDLALGNIVNNAKFGRIHFHPQPRQQDRSVVQGRKNHAFGQEEAKPKVAASQQQEYVNGRKNHAYPPPEDATKKAVAQSVDAWQEIINIQMKQWVTASQQARLENELNAGLAAGRSRRDISTNLAAIIKDQQRGR